MKCAAIRPLRCRTRKTRREEPLHPGHARYSRFILVALLFLAPAVGMADGADAWRSVFDRPEALSRSDGPLVCVLNIQHPEVIRKQLADQGAKDFTGKRFPDRVRALCGPRCLHLHFTEVTGKDLDRPNVKAILIGGRSRLLSPDRDPEFFSLIRNPRIPMIGFCGGLQLIGKAFSANVPTMRDLSDGETDPNPSYHPGLFKEWGFLPVEITRRNPLFESLPDEIMVREAHMAHMLAAPPEFEVLAATAECPVQAIKHRQRILYGTQFHSEAYDDAHPQGRINLQNFLRLAGSRRSLRERIAEGPPFHPSPGRLTALTGGIGRGLTRGRISGLVSH